MLFKRKDSKFWWYKYTAPDGKVVRQSTGTTDKRRAQELADTCKAGAWRVSKLKEKPRYIWQDAVVKWLQESQKRTIKEDQANFRWLDAYLGHKVLAEIDQTDIDRIITAKLNQGVSYARVNRITALVSAVLHKARNYWGWIDYIPPIRKFAEPKKRIRWLTPDEAAKLLAELPPHLEAMARFSLLTGLRESNVTKLEWNQIDLQRQVAWIHPDQAKAGKGIGIPLYDEVMHIIRSQFGNNPRYVFVYKGKPVLRANNHAWTKALARADIADFRWHDLRHTWASWHVQAGTPLNELQELGGWSDYKMVLRYAHLAPEHLARYAANVVTATDS
ncbi:integrase Int [Methyloglobulus morosus KoM1]|uniref:Integrase Int n=1 Tax=Methyloglobulus morosus KoM1 TaxID=1116472 RepID=V5DGL2_9GAMM|nr:site-specific integrase [Methyloglobulus morosus]ESS66526.1 integrase Int [Methyloglobulus morosus KoM1]